MDEVAQLSSALAGRYEIVREIGAGGMATVYLARDMKHERNVALKVLKPELGAVLGVDRFLAEIRVTANLQHPNLLPLFDSGEAAGLLFYVMPFVDGESLRARLDREKQLSLEEALTIAVSIASALDYAHRQGVIHRDLKPENILLHEGQPLVADFGIALAVTKAGGARITQTGLSLGTPQYMSPEQATGDRHVDGRTDIYSLGAVTYEMLAGEPPHTGPTAQAIIAKLMTEKVRSLSMTRHTVPATVDGAVRRALEKLPADRFATAHEFSGALQQPSGGGPAQDDDARAGTREPSRPRGRVSRLLSTPYATGLALMIAAAGVFWGWFASHRDEPRPAVRFPLTLLPGERVPGTSYPGNTVAISPDGKVIAYLGDGTAGLQIFIRPLSELRARAIAGTEGAQQPFFSRDGKWVGFLSGQQLKKVAVDGGAAILIAELAGGMNGASWAADDRIVLSTNLHLAVVPAAGGTPRPLAPTEAGAGSLQAWPCVLADGKTILFSRATGSLANSRIGVASLETDKVTILDPPGTSPLGVIDGLLVYASTSGGSLMAVPFDQRRRRVTGAPASVIEGVAVGFQGAAKAALSLTGSLVYLSGSSSSQLVLADQKGSVRPLMTEPRTYGFPRFSPDGRRIAVSVTSPASTDVWIYGLDAHTFTRLTSEGLNNDRAEWTPDGNRVLFRSDRGGTSTLWWQPTDGSGPAQRLLEPVALEIWEGVFAPDGRTLVYRIGSRSTADLWYRHLDGDTTPKPIATAPFEEKAARVSPDGRWVAYVSEESGTHQVYVRPFPGLGARVQVTVDGGDTPVWSRDGRHLYFYRSQQLLAAAITTAPAFRVTGYATIFERNYDFSPPHAGFDVSPDGKQFLLLSSTSGEARMLVVHDWRFELRARMSDKSPK